MEFMLYSLSDCPFCKHFRRIFWKALPEGRELLLENHNDPRWVEKDIHYVPTVVVYENGKEVDRLESIKLVGIRYNTWLEWFAKYEGEIGTK